MLRDIQNNVGSPAVKMKPLTVEPPYFLISWQRRVQGDAAPIRLVLIGITADDGSSRLVETSRFSGGRRFLAGICDCGDRVLTWMELWVQYPMDRMGSPAAQCGVLNNERLDAEWLHTVAALTELLPDGAIDSGWNPFSASPLVVDVRRRCVVPWADPVSGMPLTICRDDNRLRDAKLPGYRNSLERWFETSSDGIETRWLRLTDILAAEPRGGREDGVDDADAGTFLPLNPAAGGMLLRTCSFLTLGSAVKLVEAGLASLAADLPDSSEPNDLTLLEARIVQESSPCVSRLDPFSEEESALESLFRRLDLWHQSVVETLRHSDYRGMPLLNLSANSFRVSVGLPAGRGNDSFSFSTHLVQPGEAMVFTASVTQSCFVPLAGFIESGMNDGFGGWKGGTGTVRLTQITEVGDGVRLEGFLEAAGLRGAALPSLLWLAVSAGGNEVTFLATLEPEQVGSRASVRFKAVLTEFLSDATLALRSVSASRFPCRYYALRPVDPAFDVHALGLLGIHLVLGDDRASVEEIEDDLFDLATLLPSPCDVAHLRLLAESPDLSDRIVRLLSPDGWTRSGNSAAIPRDLWLAVIRTLAEFVTVEENLERAFLSDAGQRHWLEPLKQRRVNLERLVHHTRGLITAPRAGHEEIARTIYRFVRTER